MDIVITYSITRLDENPPEAPLVEGRRHITIETEGTERARELLRRWAKTIASEALFGAISYNRLWYEPARYEALVEAERFAPMSFVIGVNNAIEEIEHEGQTRGDRDDVRGQASV